MNDDDIRKLLHHAVSDVNPVTDVRDVLARTEQRPRRNVGWIVPLAAAAAVASVLGGVGWINRDTIPGGADRTASRTVDVTTYSIGDTSAGPRLFAERRSTMADSGNEAQAAVAAALSGPLDPDYRSGLPARTTASVTVGDDKIVIDLHGTGLSDAPPQATDSMFPIYALARTAQKAVPRPTTVEIKINGAGFDRLLGKDVSADKAYAVKLPPTDELLSPLSLNLNDDSVVKSGQSIEGSAWVFEGTVGWSLTRDGKVVREGSAQTHDSTKVAPFAFTLKAPPGRYILTVSEDAVTDEGPPPTEDTKTITIE